MSEICIQNISKSYNGRSVLNALSFSVRDGEFLSILGPSGCGKTTLLRILIGLLSPDTGVIFLDGVDITTAAPSDRHMGMVFQNLALFENMTVLKNVEYALRFHHFSHRQAREAALNALAQVGLEAQADKRPGQLSTGQQQRAAIARTLVLKPNILLFDEPMSALDADNRLLLRQQIKKLQAELKATILYVTHDQEEAFALSDRIMVLQEGQIRQLDTPDQIWAHPADSYVKSFVNDNLTVKLEALKRFQQSECCNK